MWWTSQGVRVLAGAEARLFRECLGFLVDEICMAAEHGDDDMAGDVGVFDSLSSGQKLAMLDLVGRALLRKDVPVPPSTAVSEAAVGAIYRQLRIGLALELDDPEASYWWRSMVLDACRDRNMPDLPSEACGDPGEWDLLVECLKDQILWDADGDHDLSMLDAAPEVTEAFSRLLGIPKDYYTAIAPDPMPKELVQIRSRLRELYTGPT